MKGLTVLKSVLAGGASLVALMQPVAGKQYDVPGGDLSAALSSYMKQSTVQLVFADDVVQGHRSRGARGEYTETAALTQILRGTGLQAQTMATNAVEIVPAKEVQVAQKADRPAKAPSPPPSAVETVVVTAEKKKEDIQQVPISVTALSQSQLTERQIAAGPDLIRDVPNMNFGKTNFAGYSIELRGIGTQAISVTTDPAVAVAFNGVPFLRNHFFEQEFFDLDNIEVLRGPQGTLYGRNATAGVVNLIPALPTDHFEAIGSADIGNYSNRRFEGMINLPIVRDKLDIRAAAEWTKRDGYTDDTTLSTQVDGRDLWSGRVTIGFQPTSDLQMHLVWEHFQEDDGRLRSSKQLCKTDVPPTSVAGVPVPPPGSNPEYSGAFELSTYLTQGCVAASLYSPQSFEVPYGPMLPYVKAGELEGAINAEVDPYAETTQSSNLRQVQMAFLPHYRAKNDLIEFNVDYKLTPALTLTSQTGWNSDFLYSTEDYNRFDSTPGLFVPNLATSPTGYQNVTNAQGVFCDPQVGCSDRLVAQDLSDERSRQFGQEFRLASNFSGPFNFNVGGNYLHYETEENYYVFINTLTIYTLGLAPIVPPTQQYIPGVTNNSGCLNAAAFFGYQPLNPVRHQTSVASSCSYIDPNPIGSVNNMGHNYFLSQNPYFLNSYAAFGETYYNILPDLKFTAGLRFTEDQKTFYDVPSELLTDGFGYYQTGTVRQKWDRLTGRAVLDWSPQLDFTDQSLFYASYAHGYKAGGANPPGAALLTNGLNDTTNFPDHPLTFKPEYIEAFELGTKNTLLGGALTLNADIFYYNYTGYQISEIVDRTAINNNYNAHVEGAEIESNWEPLPGLRFNFAGGWEETGAAAGDNGIDLIDRTAGNPNWMVVRPYPTQASSCILPTYVVAALLQTPTAQGYIAPPLAIACGQAYLAGADPVTQQPYVANPTVATGNSGAVPPGYIGFNPATAPNNGEGFSKNLSGHQLPNAPPFTVSFGSQYTMPVSEDWAATLRGDFYWQADSWARIFNDNPYDRLHGYTNLNLALILTSDDGWQVMGYIKNVFNTTAVTGDFLNSDDSGLTTNVFLTDPRLYGIRVTKDFGEGDTGAMAEIENYIAGLFADTSKSKPALWITLGGDTLQQSGQGEPFVPPFLANYSNSAAYKPTLPQHIESLHTYSYDKEAELTYQPDGSDWQFKASIQFGRTSRTRNVTDEPKPVRLPNPVPSFYAGAIVGHGYFTPTQVDFSSTQARESETHTIVDFEAGKDLGIGIFGPDETSTVDFGIRIAQFASKSASTIHARPDLRYFNAATSFIKSFFHSPNLYLPSGAFHTFAAQASAKRRFHGIGPKISWNDSVPFAGSSDSAQLALDWGANGALLFGRRKATGEHHESGHYHDGAVYGCNLGICGNGAYYTHAAQFSRSKQVTVPNLGGFVGVSVNYINAKVSLGYRGDFFFGAMDTGWDQKKTGTVGFFGPFANLSVGF